MSWIAEYDTQGREFPTCVHVTKTTGTMTHGATYVPIEDGKAVRAENAKLREEFNKMDVWHSKELTAAMAENAKLRERIDAAHMSRLLTENENEKLRELLQRLLAEYRYLRVRPRKMYLQHEARMRAIEEEMRELGVEVEE